MEIEKLTQEQEQLIEVVKQRWLDKIFKNEPHFDEKKCREGIEWLYNLAGLKKPVVIIVDSPYSSEITFLYHKTLLNDKEWAKVGDQVRDQVWAKVWAKVGDQVRDQVWAKVWAKVWAQVWDQVEDQVWDKVGAQVRDQVGAKVGDQVWNQVRDKVGDQVRDQVGAQVRDKVGDQVELYFSIYGNISDFGWVSFFDFFKEIGLLKHDLFDKFSDFIQSGIYDSIQLDGLCIVCKMPKKINRSAIRLHSEDSAAIEWADGYKLYFWNGVPMPEKAIMSKDTISKEDIIKEINAEKRRCYMEILGAKKYYDIISDGKGLKLLDEDTDNQGYPMRLYETSIKDNIINKKVQFLEVTCPSTQRVYNIYPPNQKSKNVWDAKASTFSYENLFVRHGDVGLVKKGFKKSKPVLET